MTDRDQAIAIAIFEVLSIRFNENELRTLSFYLDIDYDNLDRGGKEDRARELVLYLKRRNRLNEILQKGNTLRPDIEWNNITSIPIASQERYSSLLYDSRDESPPYFTSHWEYYSSVGNHRDHIKISKRALDRLPTLEFITFANEDVGANKHIRAVVGQADFEYQAISSQAQSPNIVIYIVPAQINWLDPEPRKTETIHRKKYIIPRDHIGDNQWHKASVSFDFSNLSNIFHSIFAPRINEGCLYVGAAQCLLSNIQIYTQ